MADERSGVRKARFSVAKAMVLIALTAAVLRWPPLVLAAAPVVIALGYRALRVASAAIASVVAPLSLMMGVAVCVLWMRSYDLADGWLWRFRGGHSYVRACRGHGVVGLELVPGWVVPAGSKRLDYRPLEAYEPPLFGFPYFIPGILPSPEDGSWGTYWRWGGFAWSVIRSPRLGTLHTGGVVPFWYLAIIMAVCPLGWTILRWQSGRE